ncbi:MAG: choice-of-anchor D domain-containing protein, partial [Myxococcales bacterium]|nr:choice-of-anchor D domain-containing protein [Myxococcales bacterium]
MLPRRARSLGFLSLLFALACGRTPTTPPDGGAACDDDSDCPIGETCSGGSCAGALDAGADAPGAPNLLVAPAALDFGSPALGTETTLSVELENAGGGVLRLLLVEVQEPGALTEYTASPSGTVALELQPGATTTVRVTLRPEDDEVDLGSLRIVSDDLDDAVVVVPLLSSFKGTPILAVVPAALDFGVVPWGTSVVRDVDVSNVGTGNALLTVSSALITDTTGLGDAFSIEPFLVATGAPGETPTSFPVLLDPGGDRLRLRVTLATATLGAGPTPDEELVLTTDAVAPSDAERRIPLTGTVLGCAAPAAESCNGRDDDCD